jgi:hypothetical protein
MNSEKRPLSKEILERAAGWDYGSFIIFLVTESGKMIQGIVRYPLDDEVIKLNPIVGGMEASPSVKYQEVVEWAIPSKVELALEVIARRAESDFDLRARTRNAEKALEEAGR